VLLVFRRGASKVLSSLAGICVRVSEAMWQPAQEEAVSRWFKDKGDKTLRLDYDLDAGSVVFDVGGYEGQWASDIYSMYCCTVHVFEPVPEFAERIQKRFSNNAKIVVHKFGLSNESKQARLSLAQDGSSLFKQDRDSIQVTLVRAMDFLEENAIGKIDLVKINIEGAEYDLLEHLIDSGHVGRIRDIQVQFHRFIPNAEERRASIQQRLQKTHSLTYAYPFVWENWRIRDALP